MGVKIEAVGVSYSYEPGGVYALKNVSLRVEPGKCYAVLGPNASGKTTLLKVLTLVYKPSRGRVLYDGVDPWSSDVVVYRRKAVYVHEKPILVKGTVYDNIALGLRLRGVDGGVIGGRVREAASLLGLTGLLGESARRLSAGLKQAVALARALAVDPEVLALDEAFANLDSEKRLLLARILQEFKKKSRTILLATHDLSLVPALCDHVFYLEEGQLKLEGPVDEVLGRIHPSSLQGQLLGSDVRGATRI